MSDNPTGTEQPSEQPPQTPPQTPPTPPQTPPQTPPAQPHPNDDSTRQGGSDGLKALQTEMAALPERIVSAIREATQPPKQPETPAAPQTPKEPAQTQTPGKKSFAEWWFGK